MADKNKGAVIIKKKKIVGGHGHHGGAWKVAYADFVTAMMAFFLVMWLMGSDDETKAAISHYFNHPNTPYHNGRDPASDMARPLGERVGAGESVLSGMNGENPEDLVPNPVPPESYPEGLKEMGELLAETLEGKVFGIRVEEDYLSFSVPESILFQPGTSRIKVSAEKYLDRIGRIIQEFKGHIRVEDYSDELSLDGREMASFYEASIVKAVAITNYFTDHNWFAEERIHPGTEGKGNLSLQERKSKLQPRDRRVEFTLTQFKTY